MVFRAENNVKMKMAVVLFRVVGLLSKYFQFVQVFLDYTSSLLYYLLMSQLVLLKATISWTGPVVV